MPKKNKCLPKMVGEIRVLPLTFEKKILVHLSFTKTSTKACAFHTTTKQHSPSIPRGNPWLSDRSKPWLIKQKHTDRHRPPIEKLYSKQNPSTLVCFSNFSEPFKTLINLTDPSSALLFSWPGAIRGSRRPRQRSNPTSNQSVPGPV